MKIIFAIGALLVLPLFPVKAASISIGEVDANGMTITASYLQSVLMDGMEAGNMEMQSKCDLDSVSAERHMSHAGMMNVPRQKENENRNEESSPVDEISIGPLKDNDFLDANASVSKIHLSAYVTADEGNEFGFKKGSFIPYLQVCYVIKKQGSDFEQHGFFMPMQAMDGPHYGANAMLSGVGQYRIDYFVSAPRGLYRHVDKETGIGAWWQPFHVGWDFFFIGTGKKGSY